MSKQKDQHPQSLQTQTTTSGQHTESVTVKKDQAKYQSQPLKNETNDGKYCMVCNESFNHKPKCTNKAYGLATEQELTAKK